MEKVMVRSLFSQRVWVGLFLLFTMVVGSIWYWKGYEQTLVPSVASFPQDIRIGERSWHIFAVADTPEKRTKGLADRARIEAGTGMVFFFPNKDKYGFWMKGMQFPLDIIFIRDDRVDSVARGLLPGDLTLVFPEYPIDRVLEVNAGEAKEVESGQLVSWY